MISFQRFYTAPSGPEDRAASCAQTSGGLQYRFRITLIDADKDQGVFVSENIDGSSFPVSSDIWSAHVCGVRS